MAQGAGPAEVEEEEARGEKAVVVPLPALPSAGRSVRQSMLWWFPLGALGPPDLCQKETARGRPKGGEG
jgi:hypothetical protein